MRRFAHRLRPRWPRWLAFAGAAFVTASCLGVFLAAVYDPALKPHQRTMAMALAGAFALVGVVGFAGALRLAILGGETAVEVDRLPVARGTELLVFVLHRGPRVEARLVCFKRRGHAEDRVVDLPLGSAEAVGLRAQLEARVTLPADAEATRYDIVRWCVEVRAPDRTEQFPLSVA